MNSWFAAILGMVAMAIAWWIWSAYRNGSLNRMVGRLLGRHRVFYQDFQVESFTLSGVLRIDVGQPYREPSLALFRAILSIKGQASKVVFQRPIRTLVPEESFQTAVDLASQLESFQVIREMSGLGIRTDKSGEWDRAAFESEPADLKIHPPLPRRAYLPGSYKVTATVPFGDTQLFAGDLSITQNGETQMTVRCHKRFQDEVHRFLAERFKGLKHQFSSGSYTFNGEQSPMELFSQIGSVSAGTISNLTLTWEEPVATA